EAPHPAQHPQTATTGTPPGPSGPESENTMTTKTGSERKPGGLPGPSTASAAIQGRARAAAPPSRGSPGNGWQDGPGPPMAGQVTGMHTGAAPTWNRRPA